jgi:hypothetical protein
VGRQPAQLIAHERQELRHRAAVCLLDGLRNARNHKRPFSSAGRACIWSTGSVAKSAEFGLRKQLRLSVHCTRGPDDSRRLLNDNIFSSDLRPRRDLANGVRRSRRHGTSSVHSVSCLASSLSLSCSLCCSGQRFSVGRPTLVGESG